MSTEIQCNRILVKGFRKGLCSPFVILQLDPLYTVVIHIAQGSSSIILSFAVQITKARKSRQTQGSKRQRNGGFQVPF